MMGKRSQLFTVLLLLPLLFVACTESNGNFRIEGSFKNFNQGELYVYSLDPQAKGLRDTIQLMNGKFAYELAVEDSLMLSIIFPNYSELPVFASKGGKVTVSGDASHLKGTEVHGTAENDLLTDFRLTTNELMPPEVVKAAAKFVEEHPLSGVSLYLINKHFVLRSDPDYKQAIRLLDKMIDASPANDNLQKYRSQLQHIQSSALRSSLPKFAAVTVDGKKVSDADLKGKIGIISIWSTWQLDGYMQQQIHEMTRKYGSRLAVLAISMDPSIKDCRDAMRRDSITWPTVCDGLVWQSPIVDQLGITAVPDNMVVNEHGTIIARSLSTRELVEKIKTLIP
jgi:hypothetical protein